MRNRIVASVRRRHALSPKALLLRHRTVAACLAACITFVGVLLVLRHGYRRHRSSGGWRYMGPVQEDTAGMLADITYIGDREVDAQLGCPVATHGCFYSFVVDAEPLRALSANKRPEAACHRVLRNCNMHGNCIKRRDWCLLRGMPPAWLLQRFPASAWREESRPAYLFGRSEGNPTHVTCLHMLPLLRWMETAGVPSGRVVMIWDHGKKDGPGAYGEGLGAPLGEMRWLDDMAGPLTFRRLRMGEAGDLRFPYHLLKHEVGLPVDPTLVRLADLAKAAAGLELRAPASRPKVIIALRRRTRVLTNAAELAAALAAASMEATVAEFGTMTFAEQMVAVHDAAVLVSVHGADCMNLMFLPLRGVIVEIDPVHYGYGQRKILRKGDYYNLAQLAGKTHMEYVTPFNATILRNTDGGLVDWNHVNFVGEVTVDVQELVVLVKAAVMSACGSCYQACGPMNKQGEVQCVPEQASAGKLVRAGLTA